MEWYEIGDDGASEYGTACESEVSWTKAVFGLSASECGSECGTVRSGRTFKKPKVKNPVQNARTQKFKKNHVVQFSTASVKHYPVEVHSDTESEISERSFVRGRRANLSFGGTSSPKSQNPLSQPHQYRNDVSDVRAARVVFPTGFDKKCSDDQRRNFENKEVLHSDKPAVKYGAAARSNSMRRNVERKDVFRWSDAKVFDITIGDEAPKATEIGCGNAKSHAATTPSCVDEGSLTSRAEDWPVGTFYGVHSGRKYPNAEKQERPGYLIRSNDYSASDSASETESISKKARFSNKVDCFFGMNTSADEKLAQAGLEAVSSDKGRTVTSVWGQDKQERCQAINEHKSYYLDPDLEGPGRRDCIDRSFSSCSLESKDELSNGDVYQDDDVTPTGKCADWTWVTESERRDGYTCQGAIDLVETRREVPMSPCFEAWSSVNKELRDIVQRKGEAGLKRMLKRCSTANSNGLGVISEGFDHAREFGESEHPGAKQVTCLNNDRDMVNSISNCDNAGNQSSESISFSNELPPSNRNWYKLTYFLSDSDGDAVGNETNYNWDVFPWSRSAHLEQRIADGKKQVSASIHGTRYTQKTPKIKSGCSKYVELPSKLNGLLESKVQVTATKEHIIADEQTKAAFSGSSSKCEEGLPDSENVNSNSSLIGRRHETSHSPSGPGNCRVYKSTHPSTDGLRVSAIGIDGNRKKVVSGKVVNTNARCHRKTASHCSLSAGDSSTSSEGGSVSSMHSSIMSPPRWWDRNTSEGSSVQWSGSEINAGNSDASKVQTIITTSPNEKKRLGELYQQMLNWVDSELKLFNFTEVNTMSDTEATFTSSVDIPSLAVVFFLNEKELLSNNRIQTVVDFFKSPPWKFHHSESVQRGNIHLYPPNSQDYYFTSEDLPLCAARQVHYGKEHIRLTRFVSHENWQEMVDMYQLILSMAPDARKVDFCLFTICVRCNYTIQFALKRLPKTVQPKLIRTITLQFKVSEIGLLVPLLPNMCTPLSETKWLTTDHDGNSIILKVSGASSSSSNSSANSSQTQPLVSSKLGFFV